MSDKTISGLPSATLPLTSTDLMLVSRDGVVLNKVNFSDVVSIQSVGGKVGVVPFQTAAETPNTAIISANYPGGVNPANAQLALDSLAAKARGPQTINFASNADRTLTAAEANAPLITLTDTGVLLTAARNVIVEARTNWFIVVNSTAQTLTVKTAAGTGVQIAAGTRAPVACDGTNVFDPYSGTLHKTGDGETLTATETKTTPMIFTGGLRSHTDPSFPGQLIVGNGAAITGGTLDDGIAIGRLATGYGRAIVIGRLASAQTTGSYFNDLAVFIGPGAGVVTGANLELQVAIGNQAKAAGPNGIAIGNGAQATQGSSIAIGNNALSTVGSIALGQSRTTGGGQLAFGTSDTLSSQASLDPSLLIIGTSTYLFAGRIVFAYASRTSSTAYRTRTTFLAGDEVANNREAIRYESNGTSAQVGIGGAIGGTNLFTVNGSSYFTGFMGLGTASVPAAIMHSSGNVSSAAWTTNGIRRRSDAATYTDTSSSGTVASVTIDLIGSPTIASTSATTFTDAAAMTVNGPVAGTNATLTNRYGLRTTGGTGTGTNSYGLRIDAGTGATNNYAAVFTGGNVGIGTTTPLAPLDVNATGNAIKLLVPSSDGTSLSSIQWTASGQTNDRAKISVISPSSSAFGLVFQTSVGDTFSFIPNSQGGGGSGASNLGIGSVNKLSRLTVQQAPDISNITGTTAANAATTITGTGTFFLSQIGIGDRISLSSAAATYATVISIASDTSLIVNSALGNGTTQSINVKHSVFRLDSRLLTTQFLVNDQGNVGIGTITPNKTLDVSGDIQLNTIGNGIYIKEGSNSTMGVATMTSSSVTVSNTKVTATSRIFLTIQTPSGTVGSPYISARTAGTSFTITSTGTTDNSTVAWHIIEPAP